MSSELASSKISAPPNDMETMLSLATKIEEAKTSPDEFIELCFSDATGRGLRQSQLHRDLQRFLSTHSHALIELPRDHGKTVQVCGRILWELGRNPHLRIKIISATEVIALQRGRFLRETILGRDMVTKVFPALRPGRPWTDSQFSIPRRTETVGPSVASLGIGCGATGTRADLLVCDDIVDVTAMRSRNERERIKDHFRDNLMNLLDPQGRFWGLFTPWHRDDLNAELKRNPAYSLFRRAIDEKLNPIWPERWPTERLQARLAEIGSLSFARAYRLMPLAEEEMILQSRWIRFWTDDVPDDRVVLAVDPAVSAKSTSDHSALVVLGSSNGTIRCRQAIARRVQTPVLVQLIEETDRLWNPDSIVFESNAAFAGILQMLIKHEGFGAKIKGVTQSIDKSSRVHAFSLPVENGRFLLKGSPGGGVDPSQQMLFDEMTQFPDSDHDDLLDAAMMGTKYLLETREPRVI